MWASQIDLGNLPQHVAIIMDGNGRWARERGRPRLFGHQKGEDALKAAINFAIEIGLPFLSAWAFSTANWRRPESEVMGLMNLLHRALQKELKTFHEKGVRLKVVGLRQGLSTDLLASIDTAVEQTKNNTKLTLVIALNYDGRTDILHATQRLTEKVKEGALDSSDLTEESIASHLMTAGIPDPDLLIRTSGIIRLSNFMMWQCAYTEFVFLEKNWPDFTPQDFCEALQSFQKCERKFGQISA